MALKAHTRPRGLIASLLALAVFGIILSAPPAASARNLYEVMDSSEGDPGDGVLHPTPVISLPDPLPKPASATYVVLSYVVDTSGGHRHVRPLVILLPASDPFGGSLAGGGPFFLLPAEGRWHDAP